MYDRRPVTAADEDALNTVPREPGISVHIHTDPAALNRIAEFIRRGDIHQFEDRPFVQELTEWIRFDRREALNSRDGLASGCMGSPPVPRWIGQPVIRRMKPSKQADSDVELLRSASGVVTICAARDQKSDWVRTGQVYERLALELTSRNVKSAFLNQPLEVPALRSQFLSAMNYGDGLPQLMFRFGYAAAMPQSLRRPVREVIFVA